MNIIDSSFDKINIVWKKLTEKNKISFDFLKNNLFQRWAILFFLSIGLSILLAPNLYVSNPEYHYGMIAHENIKADRDFLVEDINSTRQKKNEAPANTRPVYDYDAEMPITLKAKIMNSFALGANNLTNEQLKDLIEKSLGIKLTAKEFSFLKANKFSDDLQQKLSAAMDAFYKNTLITNTSLQNQEKDKGITLVNVITREE